MKVLVCGGRKYWKMFEMTAILDKLNKERVIHFIIHGDAPGADRLAGQWADRRGILCKPYPADWDNITRPGAVVRNRKGYGTQYDAAAGHVRNQKMLDVEKPDLVVAFPGGDGTQDMIRRAEAAGVKVFRVPQGTIEDDNKRIDFSKEKKS